GRLVLAFRDTAAAPPPRRLNPRVYHLRPADTVAGMLRAAGFGDIATHPFGAAQPVTLLHARTPPAAMPTPPSHGGRAARPRRRSSTPRGRRPLVGDSTGDVRTGRARGVPRRFSRSGVLRLWAGRPRPTRGSRPRGGGRSSLGASARGRRRRR